MFWHTTFVLAADAFFRVDMRFSKKVDVLLQ